ncbi:MAG: hypothetical protein V1914_04210 [archaeon]
MRKILLLMLGILVFVFLFSFNSVVAEDNSSNVSAANVSDVNLTDVDANVSDVQKNIEIVLARNKYLANETVEGVVKLRLYETIESGKVMLVRFGGKSYKLDLREILEVSNLTFTELPAVINPINAGSSKVVQVTSDVPAMFALKLPSEILGGVDSVDLDITGVAGNKLLNPYLDVGNDGNMDWYYLGDFIGWKSSFILPDDLDESSRDSAYLTANNPDYFCEVIDVPRTKDLKVSVKYKKLAEGGDIKAAIFSPIVPGNPDWVSGEGSVCDLPELANLDYRTCDIHLNYAAKGKLQVCVYSEIPVVGDATQLYEIATDSLEPTVSAYNCRVGAGEGNCFPQAYKGGDYFIKVQSADYTNNLVGLVDVNDWNTYPNSFAMAIENYVGTDMKPDGICTDPICAIPITVYGNGSGSLAFSNLKIAYEDNTKSTSSLFEIEQANPEIASINGNDLSIQDVTLEIPLRFFGEFRTSSPSFIFLEQVMTASFNQEEASVNLRVYRDAIPKSATEQLMDGTNNAINFAFADEDMAKLLRLLELDEGFKAAKVKMDDYSAKLLTTLDIGALELEIEGFLADLPKGIKLRNTLIDSFVAEPADITSDIQTTLGKEEKYSFQFKSDILAKVKTYDIEYNSGETVTAILVSKKITPKESLKKITVYETIPKSVAQSVEDVKFEQTPKVVNPDPVVSWYFPDFKSTDISYAIVTDSAFSLYDFKTIIVPTESAETEEEVEGFCGDFVCDSDEDEDVCPEDCAVETESSMGLIIGLVAALLFVVLYVLAFINSDNFRTAAIGGMPFKNKGQLASVMSYIAGAKAKGTPVAKIFVALKQNKWKDKQITVAYKAVELDQGLDEVLKGIPPKDKDRAPMVRYLVAGLQRGMDIKMVTNYLVKGGWTKGEVSSAYMMARIGMPFKFWLSKVGIVVK